MNRTNIFAKHRLIIAGSCLITAMSSQVQAAGFQLVEQGTAGMGTAYAGMAAVAEDASTVYTNPAGLTKLKSPQAVAALHIIAPQAEFNDQGSSHVLLGVGGLGADEGGDGGVTGTVPNFYYARPLSDKLFFGLGISTPFGLSTNYDRNWIGRYHAVKSELMTVNINPALAFKINERLSMGIGINAQYIDAELTNAIDFGSLDAAGAFAPIPAGFFGLTPTQSDGFVKLEGDDWSWGYNLGFLFDISDQTRVGAHFRSKIRHDVKGDANFTVPGGGAIEALTGNFVDTHVKSTVDLPAMASLSLVHQVDNKWTVMADVSWTDWSQMDELRFEFDSVQADGVTTLKWEDSYRYSLGATYRASDRLTYRAGIAFDETPIPNAYYRTPRIPGEDRTWLAVGVGYKYSDRLSFDFGYAHLFIKDPDIEKTPTGNPLTDENLFRGYLNGKYDASTDIISAQLKWTFN